MSSDQTASLIAQSPSYWIPVLTLVLMLLVFLGVLFRMMLTVVMRPMQHTLDLVNETMKALAENTARLNEKLAVVMDRNGREA